MSEIHRLVTLGRVRFTLKATEELAALRMGLDEQDALEVLSGLRMADLVCRVESEHAPEWLYIFKPVVAETVLYLKLCVRTDCVVISFHEDEDEEA